MFKKALYSFLGFITAVVIFAGVCLIVAGLFGDTIFQTAYCPVHPDTVTSTKTIHTHDYNVISVVAANCTSAGYSAHFCSCGDSYKDNFVPVTEHNLGAWTTVQSATCTHVGEERRYCDDCAFFETRATDATGHSYGKWVVTEEATPLSTGKRYKQCSCCDDKVSEEYTKEMAGQNAIFIPGTGIDAPVAVASFTQEAVDNNDIVYAVESSQQYPFVLGHNTGTMRTLYETKIGQYIYLSINGSIRAYKVVVSERGCLTALSDIVGQTTGASIWDTYEDDTLHLYTCYGDIPTDRWMVLATLVS